MYFDNAATTNLTEDVKEYIIEMLDHYANPSSVYQSGLDNKKLIEETRNIVKEFVNASDDTDVVFTSSGSASNTLAIKGLTNNLNNYKLFYSPTSHKSMYLASKSCRYNQELSVWQDGDINLMVLRQHLHYCKKMKIKPIVCIEYANSETGTINLVKDISYLVHKYNGILIVDATGYIPYKEVFMQEDDIDILTFSAHKLHALKGVGILCKKKNIDLSPIIYGAQENGLFGGTENFIGIMSLKKAITNYEYGTINNHNAIYVYDWLSNNVANIRLFGKKLYSQNRMPNNLYLYIDNVSGSDLVALLNVHNIQISTGSACNNGNKEPSQVLKAVNISNESIHSFIRITFTCYETIDELNKLCASLKECIEILRGDDYEQ